jgi:iron complex transport system substrate-binding protein
MRQRNDSKQPYFRLLVATTMAVVFLGTTVLPLAAAEERTVVDALDRSVQIPSDPQRIVTAGRAVLMIADVLYAFPGVPDRIVGIGRISQGAGSFPQALDPRFSEKTLFERNVGPEQIVAAAPDLVILKTFMRDSLGRPLEQLGIPVLYVELETPEQYERDIALLGTALGETERAQELVHYFKTNREKIETTTGRIAESEKPSTLLLYYRSSGNDVSFQVPPSSWIQTQIVLSAGGKPVWTKAVTGNGWQTVGLEQIAAWDPEVILLVAYNDNPDEIRDRLIMDPNWEALKAIRSGSFVAFPGDYYSWDQPDTRWILGLQWTAAQLHPDQFPGFTGRKAAQAFFSELYGMDGGTFERIIVPTLTGAVD